MTRHDEGFFTARDQLRLYWESDLPESPGRTWRSSTATVITWGATGR